MSRAALSYGNAGRYSEGHEDLSNELTAAQLTELPGYLVLASESEAPMIV
ncbi:hypothetical protein ACFLSG_03355 [Candidatus Bipolaricaulota bacterium]